MKIEKIFAIPHFHFDFEWWKEEPHHENDTLIIIDEALRMLENYPEFTYVIDTVLPLKNYIEKRSDGYEKIKHFLDQGRLEIVGGDIIAPDEVLPTGESLFRQFEMGQEWFEETFGIRTKIAWEIDEFAHPDQLPQLLGSLGFEYFVFARGVHPFDAMHPTLFNWEDPVGKHQLTSYWWGAHYEGLQLPQKIQPRDRKKLLRHFFTEMENRIAFEGSRSPVPFLMMPFGGDFVIPNEIWIDFVNMWNEKKDIKISFSTPSQYFRSVKNFKLPVVKGEFKPIFDGYFTSREESKKKARKHANELIQLEIMEVISSSSIHSTSIADLKKETWWELLKCDFHDTITGTGTDRVFRKNMQRYQSVQKNLEALKNQIISDFGKVLNGNGPWVLNSSPYHRRDFLLHHSELKQVNLPPFSICSLTNVFSMSNDQVKVTSKTVENELLRLEADLTTGEIAVYDKEKNFYPVRNNLNRTNIIDDVGNLWVTRTLNRQFGVQLQDIKIFSHSAEEGKIVITEKNSFLRITKEISLRAGLKTIYFNTEIEFQGKDKRIEMTFPFNFSGRWKAEKVFNITEAAADIHPVQNFALYTGEDYKIALINRGIPGYKLEKSSGKLILMRSVSMISWSWILWVIKNAGLILRSLRKAATYLFKKLNIIEFPVYPVHNLFLRDFASEGDTEGHGAMNEKSHRKARQNFNKESLAWERGVHHFEYTLNLDVQNIFDAQIMAQHFNQPLHLLDLKGSGHNEYIQLMEAVEGEIAISSLRKSENGWLLRAWEPSGKTETAKFRFLKDILSVSVIEKPGITQELEVVNNSFSYRFQKNEIVLFSISIKKD